MSRTLTEQQVLKKIGKPDFRHITKDDVVHLATMLPQMDIEVAKKVIEQFPEYGKNIVLLAQEYNEIAGTVRESNEKTVNRCIEICDRVIDDYQKKLDKENISEEDKKFYASQIIEVLHIMADLNKENQNFLLSFLRENKGLIITLVFALGAALGVKLINKKPVGGN